MKEDDSMFATGENESLFRYENVEYDFENLNLPMLNY